MNHLYFGALLGIAPAGPVLAVICTFATECFETERCQDTTFALDYAISSDRIEGFRAATAETDFGSLLGIAPAVDAGVVLVLRGGDTQYFLTHSDAGARLSVHMAGPSVVTYHGVCE